MKSPWIFLLLVMVGSMGLAGCGRETEKDKTPELVVAGNPEQKIQDSQPKVKEPNASKTTPDQGGKSTGGGALGQTVDFLGSQATGNRFCIIADHSMSLSPASFNQIKKEILRTLRALHESSQFHLIFFDAKPIQMPGGPWLAGGKDVDKIVHWIEALPRAYGTKGTPAFRKAFALKPRPDVIFFMTDGIIPAKDPEQIVALNRAEPRTIINTILFNRKGAQVDRGNPARQHLERIALENGGTFHQFLWQEPEKKGKKGKK